MKNKNLIVTAVVALVVSLGVGFSMPTDQSIDLGSQSKRDIKSVTLEVSGVSTLKGEVAMKETSEAITAANTLTVAESFTTSYVSGAASTSTLPAVASSASTVYRFVIGASLTGDHSISSAEGDNIEGSLIVAGAVVDCDAEDSLTFVSDGENLGDFVELRSNGTSWFVTSSNVLTSAKLTCIDPS